MQSKNFYFKSWRWLFKNATFRQKVKVLYSFYKIPAFVVHELLHLMVIILTFSEIKSVKFVWCKFIGYRLQTYDLTITITHKIGISHYIKMLLISAAPLLIFIIIPFLPCILAIYFLTCWNVIIMSEIDKQTFHKHFNDLKNKLT